MAVIGLITYNGKENNEEAQQKAQELTQAYKQEGLRVPAEADTIAESLGTDGGAICENPGDGLGQAILFDQLTNGASQVGKRPVIIDPKVLRGQALIMQTYCPDDLAEYQDKIKDLKTDDTIKD